MNRLAPLALLALLAPACGDDGPSPGTLDVTIYGEEYIEDTIPADVFADGWSVTFDTFVVGLGQVAGQAGHDAEEVSFTVDDDFDLAVGTDGAGHPVHTFEDAPGGTYDHFGYLIDGVAVAGSATDGTDTVTFAWAFDIEVVHSHCDTGVTVDGDEQTVQITIHGDHLFYDDAVSEEPAVAFQAIADADGADGSAADGDITAAELAAVDISVFERYQVGSLPIDDLLEFVTHQVTTVGHLNGEGHCEEVSVRD
jgi:hypothetical protein